MLCNDTLRYVMLRYVMLCYVCMCATFVFCVKKRLYNSIETNMK